MHPKLESKMLYSNDDAQVGRFTYGSPKFLRFPSACRAQIGSFCSIADCVTFVLGGEHIGQRNTTYPINLLFPDLNLHWHEKTKGPTVVGHDVWIGYRATILSGVNIGTGAIIGACSVVVSDVEPYSIVAGNPAKKIGVRKTPEQIAELLESNWWTWDFDKIRSHALWLLSDS
jgi:acetyltransferase-like isoleucine patch superfamily enzyme